MAQGRPTTEESVTIHLEHDIDEQYQYQPGEIIRGKIVLKLHRNTLINTVFITITGEGLCSWEEEDFGAFQSNENYINATKVIYDADGLAKYLDRGFHDFPFEYQLPDNIPSSFIGKFGSVTYILKATVQKERPGDITIATEPFLVMRKFKLPEEVNEQQDLQMAKTYFAMCSWGKIKANIKLNKTGFVPGEDMAVQAEVQNRSPLRITAIQACIMMNSNYHAQKNTVTYKQIVNKRRDDNELMDGDGRRWQNVRLPIPAYIPESFLQCCDIIDLSYIFQFRIELSGGKELKVEIPIIIGSNPKGLEVPDENNTDVNIHWTMGPRHLARQKLEEQRDMGAGNKWTDQVLSPEFRENNTQVMNPLFRNESERKPNGERLHYDRKRSDDSINIEPDYPDANNTRL